LEQSVKKQYRCTAKEALERAKEHLEHDGPCFIRYAALELRMCIESIVYMDLNSYPSGSIPVEAFDTWQPPKVVQYILERDENYHDDGVMYVAKLGELLDADGKLKSSAVRIEQKSLGKKITNKSYHMLGNLLHVPTLKQLQKESKAAQYRERLQGLAEELEKRIKSPLQHVNINENIEHACDVCRYKNVFKLDIASNPTRQYFHCGNKDCKAEFVLYYDDDGDLNIGMIYIGFDCQTCKKENKLWRKDMALGAELDCVHCGETHEVSFKVIKKILTDNKAELAPS